MDTLTHSFVAYPGGQPIIKEAIENACTASIGSNHTLQAWEKIPIHGLKIDDLIRQFIDKCSSLIADVSVANFNVYYEIGFALARQKPVVLIINSALQNAKVALNRIGIFDNIGWIEYSNGPDLVRKLAGWDRVAWVQKYEKSKDHAQPLFILDTLKKIDFTQNIQQSVKHRSVNFRIFDPMEVPRLSASRAVGDISSSAGIILPILTSDVVDYEENNLRAAFLAGLAHGYDVEPLLIQYGNGPAPLDYREFVTNTASRTETERHVDDYCSKVLIRNQASDDRATRFQLGMLNQIDLGQSAAENESLSLPAYFINTAEFARADRADHALVIGRKGSGKTAIFYQIRNKKSREKDCIVVDLRPATHNLSELRANLMDISNQGVFDHTIAAFWNYIIYSEILLKIREHVLPYSKRDFEIQNKILKLEKDLNLDELSVSGDFTSRLASAVTDVISSVRNPKGNTIKSLTNNIYEDSIPRLREMIGDFGDFFDDIVLLFDDLDKGWPPKQLEVHDIQTIKHLIEVIRKIERDLRRKNIPFKSILFLRSDVYELLVDNTPDRGKYNPIVVDWSDKAQLTYLLRERVGSKIDASQRDEAWDAVNVVTSDGHYAIDKLLDASLFRPRFLIEACEKVISTAVNRGHSFVKDEDLDHGLRQMSRYLVSDFAYELRDVSGVPADLFYRFLGQKEHLTRREIETLTRGMDGSVDIDDLIDLLLWYGFLGVVLGSGKSYYIFDCNYDERRLLASRDKDLDEVLYCVNRAFLLGLEQV